MIKVRSIGAAEVQIGRRRITRSTEVVLAVAVYLCVRAGERIARDEVVEIFWPDTDLTKGRHSLRQILYRLRQKGFALDEDGGELYLDPARVDCDARDALRETWPETAEPWMLEDSGEFLPSFAREISVQFREWLDATRSRIAAQYRSAALLRLAEARREGRWADMERSARIVLRADPLNETATIARAESELMAGSKAMAMEILDQYVEDLGDRSGQIALPATLLRKRISERRTEWGSSPVAPLIGREALMSDLTAAIMAASDGQGGAYLLRGASGIGKTRLSDEARAFAEMAGFRAVHVRVQATLSRHPLSVTLSLVAQLLELRGASGCTPLAMSLLRNTTSPERSERLHTATTTTPEELAWAISSLLEALSDEHKLFIQLDDLHHCDPESLALLRRLTPASRSLRIVWLAASRIGRSLEELAPDGSAGFIALNVPPLSRESSLELARTYARKGTHQRSETELAHLAHLSGGNPLFLRELAGLRSPAMDVRSTPASLRKIILERLSELTHFESRILQVVGLLGSHATVHRVRSMMRSGPEDFVGSLEALSHSGIVSLGGSGILELHDSWRAALFEQLPQSARVALGLECAELLVADNSNEDYLDRTWRAAELLLDSGARGRAASLFELAGDELANRRLLTEAAEAYKRALAATGSSSVSVVFLEKCASVQHAARDFDATLSTCISALAATSSNGARAANSRAHFQALVVDSLWKSGRDYRSELELLAQRVSQPGLGPEACHFGALVGLRLLLNDGHSALENRFIEAIERSTRSGGATVFGQLALLIFAAERGTPADVVAFDLALAQCDVDSLTPHLQCLVLRYRSNALRWIGHFDQALLHGEESVAKAHDYGLLGELDLTAMQLAFMCMDRCDLSAAEKWLGRSREALKGSVIDERTRAHVHATGRLLLQQGLAEESLATYFEAGLDPLTDRLAKRGAVTGATMAVAAASAGRPDIARAMLVHTQLVLEREVPSLTLDYIAELTVRGLQLLDESARGGSVAKSYLARRSRLFDRPLSPFARTLVGKRTR